VNPFDMVREFHAKVGVADSSSPDISQHRMLRLRLIEEELDELYGALNCHDVIGVADALADLLYVVIGSAHQWGIPIERVFAEVHRSNMTKGDGPKREDGKIGKGPSYSPPDLSFVIKEEP
jgi:NTP pyrophosphatase (non-canonical NTP hydrolase)